MMWSDTFVTFIYFNKSFIYICIISASKKWPDKDLSEMILMEVQYPIKTASLSYYVEKRMCQINISVISHLHMSCQS